MTTLHLRIPQKDTQPPGVAFLFPCENFTDKRSVDGVSSQPLLIVALVGCGTQGLSCFQGPSQEGQNLWEWPLS